MEIRTRTIWLWAGVGVVCLFVIGFIVGERYVRGLAPKAKQRAIAALSERFDADVQLGSLTLTLMPTPRVIGEDLTIRRRRRDRGAKPFLAIKRFVASSTLNDLFHQRDHLDELRLEGLVIDIARKQEDEGEKPAGFVPKKSEETNLKILIRTLIADGAVFQIEPKTPDKDPLRFEIQQLVMHRVGPGQPLTFNARLNNAKPPGLIDSTGRFGPWQRDELRSTPVRGSYNFSNADLSVFSGISGKLASTGEYDGVLEKIAVHGTTDVPNFALKRGGAPVHLVTRFQSVVDGTDGDTLLEPVEAHFLHSTFICKGGVEKKHPGEGKTVDLDARADSARMEDILQLIVGDKQPMLKGSVRFASKILIPPGKGDVLDKLELRGHFQIGSAVFTSAQAEQRLHTLSDRASGITKKEEEGEVPHVVASNFLGQFSLVNGVADFSQLMFRVPGAEIHLTGDYGLRDQKIDMKGAFRMDATLSETQGGVKHWLLKPVDPFFKKDGAGFEVPLRISGTRDKPEISLSAFHHTFKVK